MKKDDYFYYKVDVKGRNGYSFMVRSTDELSDDDVLSRAKAAECFDDEDDVERASVDRDIDDSDINAFDDCTTTV